MKKQLFKSAMTALSGIVLMSGSALANNLIENGNFDNGLTEWTTTGNASLGTTSTSLLGTLASLQGMTGNFALLGSTTSQGTSSITQYFDASGYETITISFNWAFDYFDLTNRASDTFISLVTEDETTAIAITLQQIITSSSLVTFSSGYFSETYNVDDLVDGDGLLSFKLLENSSIFTNSVAGIDNISVEGTAPVPEPATMLLFGTGLIGLTSIARRRKNC